MTTASSDPDREPTRDEIDRTSGPLLLEFGATWCGFCQELTSQLARLLPQFPAVRHLKVEDGPGKPLGRSFRVKLWPTLVFLRDGLIVEQVSRPTLEQVREGLDAITRTE